MSSIWIWVGLVVTFGYLLLLLYLGVYGGSETLDTVSDYFVASGSLGSLIIFLTMIGSAFSSATFLGAIGIAYSNGLTGILSIGGILLTDVPALIIIGEKVWKMSKKGKDYVTPSDMLSDRYDGSPIVRILVAIIAGGFTFFYVVVQFVGMGLVLTVLSDGIITRRTAVVIIGLFMMSYIAIGGMRGVVYTDAFQSIMLWVGMIMVAIWVVLNAPDNVYIQASNQIQTALQVKNPIYLYTVGIGYGLSVITYPYLFQRFFSSQKHSSVWAIGLGEELPMVVLSVIIPIIVGIAGIVMYPGIENSDTVILEMILDMPGPLLGILMAAALAASMSSADSQILLIGSIAVRDILQPLPVMDRSSEELTFYSKLISALVTIIALAVSLINLGTLFDIILLIAIPGFLLLLPPIVAAFWWPRANKYGVIAGLFLGFISQSYLIYNNISLPYGIWIGIPGVIICSLGILIVSVVTPKPPEERVDDFIHDLRDANPNDLEGEIRSSDSSDKVSTDD
jgi:Na+/proline symporter